MERLDKAVTDLVAGLTRLTETDGKATRDVAHNSEEVLRNLEKDNKRSKDAVREMAARNEGQTTALFRVVE